MARDYAPFYRKSHRSWYIRFNGKQVRLGGDKDAAWHYWHRLEAGLEEPPASSANLETLIQDYLTDAAKRVKANTLESKRKVLKRLGKDRGDLPAERFNADAVRTWLDATGWGQSTRWFAVRIIKCMMAWAVKAKAVKENPVADLTSKPPVSRSGEAIVRPEVHARLMEFASPAHRNMLTALWETGCRPSEVCRVEARHVDLVAGCWRLEQHKGDKSGHMRNIFLSPTMVTLCQRLVQEHPTGNLFRNERGKPFTSNMLTCWLYKLRRRLGLGKVIAYGYRHGFATDALANGVPDAQVAELLGHKGTNILHKHYSHLGARTDVLRSALGKVR